MMMIELEIEPLLYERSRAYCAENPAWTLDELVTQLLRQHCNEADAVKASIQEQEARKKEE